ncbi:BTAD domain-containing putative transcriptional regulator [Nonomuraea sp. NPDC050310]|uniref:BTAD domain-containing putative transcriptional regulator n=1 Tax=Nonomuraea sp. NPDC050310 TaxID=3154935 RepID=UPI0033EF0CA8
MGSLEVSDGGQDLTPTAPKHRDLLTMFLLNARRPLTVPQLRRLLWPHEDGERSDSLVRGYVGQLRQVLGKDVITTVSGTYTLAIAPTQLDVNRFRDLVERGEYGPALALWRGQALEDVDPRAERWTQTRRLREELAELRLLALERRLEAELNAGRHREALAELRGLVERHPLAQRLHGLLLLALYRSGRRAEALECYGRLRAELDAAHAIEPDPDLQLLHHRMLHDDVSLHVAAGPPLLLPPDVTPFTGRAALLDEVVGPQVTVVHGPAGVGKSALAVHAAWRARTGFPDGILYADLRETPPGAVLEDFLRWLGCPARAVPAAADRRERLLRTYAANRRVLVVLDNVTAEAQVRPLLTAAPTVVTSRSTLAGLTGARRVAVGLLEPDEATALLSDLAGERGPYDELVACCGGLPLALRVAGARLAARPGWSAAHLAGLLADERGLLDGLHAGDLEVRSVLALGYEGLAEPARAALCRLGALSAPDFGEWLVGSAHAEPLADAGLLDPHGVDVAGQPRYRLHPLTRLFARERLDAIPQVLAELAEEVMARVRIARFTLVSGDPATILATRDIRESVQWLLAEHGFLVAFTADLGRAGLDEACHRLAHLLTPFLDRHRLLADWRQVATAGLEAARRTGQPRAEALAERDLGDLLLAEERWEEAHEVLRRALGLALRAGADTVPVRRRLGQAHLALGHLAEAERSLGRCLEAAGRPHEQALTLLALGSTLRLAGRAGEAVARLTEAAAGLAELGERHRHADALLELAEAELDRGEPAAARQAAQQARNLATRLGDRLLGARALQALARVNRAEGDAEQARELDEQAHAWLAAAGA